MAVKISKRRLKSIIREEIQRLVESEAYLKWVGDDLYIVDDEGYEMLFDEAPPALQRKAQDAGYLEPDYDPYSRRSYNITQYRGKRRKW